MTENVDLRAVTPTEKKVKDVINNDERLYLPSSDAAIEKVVAKVIEEYRSVVEAGKHTLFSTPEELIKVIYQKLVTAVPKVPDPQRIKNQISSGRVNRTSSSTK